MKIMLGKIKCDLKNLFRKRTCVHVIFLKATDVDNDSNNNGCYSDPNAVLCIDILLYVANDFTVNTT